MYNKIIALSSLFKHQCYIHLELQQLKGKLVKLGHIIINCIERTIIMIMIFCRWLRDKDLSSKYPSYPSFFVFEKINRIPFLIFFSLHIDILCVISFLHLNEATIKLL